MRELLEAEATAREALHKDHASSRPLSDGYELVGLFGEAEFSRLSGLPFNWQRKPGGDGGVDFVVPYRFTLDVKTARKPGNLIQEVGKVTCDIYVLAGYYDDEQRTECLGWEWGKILARAPTRDFGYGIVNHYIPAEKLRPMVDLLSRIMRLA